MIRDPSDGSVKPPAGFEFAPGQDVEAEAKRPDGVIKLIKKQDREFLFEYPFEGETYGLSVVAVSIEEARRKVSAMSYAMYKGEVAAKIPLNPRKWLRFR